METNEPQTYYLIDTVEHTVQVIFTSEDIRNNNTNWQYAVKAQKTMPTCCRICKALPITFVDDIKAE